MDNSNSEALASFCAYTWFLLLLFTFLAMIMPMDMVFGLLNWATFQTMNLQPLDVSSHTLYYLGVLSVIGVPLMMYSHVGELLFSVEERLAVRFFRNALVLLLAVVIPIYIWRNVKLETAFALSHVGLIASSSMLILCVHHIWQGNCAKIEGA